MGDKRKVAEGMELPKGPLSLDACEGFVRKMVENDPEAPIWKGQTDAVRAGYEYGKVAMDVLSLGETERLIEVACIYGSKVLAGHDLEGESDCTVRESLMKAVESRLCVAATHAIYQIRMAGEWFVGSTLEDFEARVRLHVANEEERVGALETCREGDDFSDEAKALAFAFAKEIGNLVISWDVLGEIFRAKPGLLYIEGRGNDVEAQMRHVVRGRLMEAALDEIGAVRTALKAEGLAAPSV